ncbi:MAG: molecular chaperone DnaJ [Desulfovibrio sp.]|nr:molecular chaperone DnaJ [Desulfovibrio sp.]
MPRDYYEILEVSRTATVEEIKQAYRKKAMAYHPDRNPGDAEAEIKFREAAEAYEVLRDPDKRSHYDRFGHAGVNSPGGGFGNADDIFSHFSDIFGDLFGFSQTRSGPQPEAGADLRYNLSISFAQAAHGAEISLKIPKRVRCDECSGSGAAKGSKRVACKRCGGRGQIHRNQGFFQLSMPCPTCQGAGTVIEKPCPRCKGEGVRPDTKEINVKVPAGVDTGTRLRIRGEGEPGVNGGPDGDLYVFLDVEPDNRWRRIGANLLYKQEITFVQAALGHRVEIPGIDGSLTMDIPKGAQGGDILKIPGEGMFVPGKKTRGDMLVELTVKTPTNLTARQEELLREFETAGEGTFEKLKKTARKIGKAMGID